MPRKKSLSLFLAALMVFSLFAPRASAFAMESEQLSFADVPADAWFAPYVQTMHTSGVMTGTTATTFDPTGQLTRAQFVATLFRIHHGRAANASDPRNFIFNDVSISAWFAPYVTWAARYGVVDVVGDDGRFVPNNHLTRQELVTMMFRFAGATTDLNMNVTRGPQWRSFTDVYQAGDWALDGFFWTHSVGLISGRTPTTIVPTGTTTRAEAAAILTRFLDLLNTEPPTSPENINIQPLLGANFFAVRNLLGSVAWCYYYGYVFDTGIATVVSYDNTIGAISILYQETPSRTQVHFNGINGYATHSDVRNIFGVPDEYWIVDKYNPDSDWYYIYQLSHTYLLFQFDGSDRVLRISYGFHLN